MNAAFRLMGHGLKCYGETPEGKGADEIVSISSIHHPLPLFASGSRA